MSGAQHTPGPWSHGHTMGQHLWVGPAYEKAPVAMINWDGFDARDEARDNARLIAAAPDLLEAIRALLDAFEYEGQTEGEDRATAKAYTAIAKATGAA